MSITKTPIPLWAFTRKRPIELVAESVHLSRVTEARYGRPPQPTCDGSGRAVNDNVCPACGQVFEAMEWSSQGWVIPRH